MAGRFGIALLLGLSLAACALAVPGTSTATATPKPGVAGSPFAALSGVPLKLPRLGPGQSCPVSMPSQLGPRLRTGVRSSPRDPGVAGTPFPALSGVPLKLPRLGPGQSCPVSMPSQLGPGLGTGLGSGPVYVLSGEIVRSDPGHSNKGAWGADPRYVGPIRIRGGRIDSAGQLLLDTFDNKWRGAPVKTLDGTGLMPELDLLESHSTFPNVPSGWRIWPSGTYVATPGCYAWQVDGLGFTELIIFHSLELRMLPAGAACPASPHQVAQ